MEKQIAIRQNFAMIKHAPSLFAMRKFARDVSIRQITRAFIISIIAILASANFTDANADHVGNLNRRANRHFERGQYEEALKLYDEALSANPNDGKLMMNRASALHRLGMYDEAEQSLHNALSNLPSGDQNALADAHYNLGNTRFRQGEQLAQAGDASNARGRFQQALESYISTLRTRPNDDDAKWNLQLAHQMIEEMEQQQQNQQDQNQDQDNDDDQDNQGGGGQDEQDQNDQQDQQGGDDNRQDQNQNDQQDQSQQQQQQEQSEQEREEAQRLIEQFADDSEELNKPEQRRTNVRQPEKNW